MTLSETDIEQRHRQYKKINAQDSTVYTLIVILRVGHTRVVALGQENRQSISHNKYREIVARDFMTTQVKRESAQSESCRGERDNGHYEVK
jgi:hypothetical protein